MNTIYSGLATFGQITSILRAVLVTLVALGLIGYGIYILWVNWDYSEDKNGMVLEDSNCTIQNGQQFQECSTKFTFSANGKSYTLTQSTLLSYKKGDKITVFYKESDPQDSAKVDFWPKNVAYILFGTGSVLLVLSWGWVYLVDRFKPLAAVTGGIGAGQLISKVL
jgi:hypothetical protein